MTDQSVDPTRRIVLSRADRVAGHDLEQGTVLHVVPNETGEPGEITADQATLLLSQGAAIYQDRAVATPVETPEQYARRSVEVDDLGKGKFLIRAPWLGEGEAVGEDDLDTRREEIVQSGIEKHRQLIDEIGPQAAVAAVTGTDGFSVADLGNGNYEIAGPGLAEPEKVRGKANAESRLADLRAAAATPETKAPGDTTAEGQGTAEVAAAAGQQGGAPISDAAPAVPGEQPAA